MTHPDAKGMASVSGLTQGIMRIAGYAPVARRSPSSRTGISSKCPFFAEQRIWTLGRMGRELVKLSLTAHQNRA